MSHRRIMSVKEQIEFSIDSMTNIYTIENLESILQCSICLDRFQSPKVLPCQHTFCLICLQRTFDNRNKTLTCPTCRRVLHLSRGPDELPNNLLLISLMDVQPVKAKCPSCDAMGTLTVCEHCHCTKCAHCNEKHIKDIRQSAKTALEQLENTSPNDLQMSIHEAFRSVCEQILKKFQEIRQLHDSILLNKQMKILQQLDAHKQSLLQQVEADLQPLEQMKSELIKKTSQLESKNEPELISLMTKLTELQSQLEKKFAEHQNHINSIEITLDYDEKLFHQINQMCDHLHLTLDHHGDPHSNLRVPLPSPSGPIEIVLRTFLNHEYRCRISLDQTILELKQKLAKQENLDPQRIRLTKSGNMFDILDDNRTLKSYDCDSSTNLIISIER